MGYAQYLFQEFENYLRTTVNLAEDDFELSFLKKVKITFCHLRCDPWHLHIENLSGSLRDLESFGFHFDYVDVGMKTRLSVGQLS